MTKNQEKSKTDQTSEQRFYRVSHVPYFLNVDLNGRI